jgi:NAD(P)-dependent dehydrogenase (short-subunit alcohol dehydrogenase family)
MARKLAGKIAVVTGGTTGFGFAMTHALLPPAFSAFE